MHHATTYIEDVDVHQGLAVSARQSKGIICNHVLTDSDVHHTMLAKRRSFVLPPRSIFISSALIGSMVSTACTMAIMIVHDAVYKCRAVLLQMVRGWTAHETSQTSLPSKAPNTVRYLKMVINQVVNKAAQKRH